MKVPSIMSVSPDRGTCVGQSVTPTHGYSLDGRLTESFVNEGSGSLGPVRRPLTTALYSSL